MRRLRLTQSSQATNVRHQWLSHTRRPLSASVPTSAKSPPLQRKPGAEGEPSESAGGARHKQHLRNSSWRCLPQRNRHLSSSGHAPTSPHTGILRDQWAGRHLHYWASVHPGGQNSGFWPPHRLTPDRHAAWTGFPGEFMKTTHAHTPTVLRPQFHHPKEQPPPRRAAPHPQPSSLPST